MNKSVALREFGFSFLGPICSEYLHHVQKQIETHSPSSLLFLAREGYFFQRAYIALKDRGLMAQLPHQYLLASRTFLFRINIADNTSWQWSLSHSFTGSLERLLVGRFGFTHRQIKTIFAAEELELTWELPEQYDELAALLVGRINELKSLVADSRATYLQYLQSLELGVQSKPLMIDVGYSGTIQKLLTLMLQCDSVGAYFITTQQGEHHIAGHTASMFPAFKDDVRMGDGYTMLDRSLLLEALLTAPNGQFVDIKKPAQQATHAFDFYFGRNSYTQNNFHELEQVFQGAIEAICEYHQRKVRFSNDEIEALFERFAYQRYMLPRATWGLFDVDDAISGHGNVNPLQLFRI